MRSVRWEIESDCNLRCKHCFIGKVVFKKSLSLDEKILVCEKLIDKNVESVALTTKEPLLNNENLEVIKKLSEANVRVLLVTNATLIDSQYANQIVMSGLNGVAISLEGVSPKSNDEIRGKGSFKSAIKGLELLNNAMVLMEKPISISVQMTINRYNYSELSETLYFFDKFNINSLSVGTIINTGNAEDNQHIILSDDEYFVACLKLARLYKDKILKNFVLEFKSLSPWESILINFITGGNLCYYIPNCSAKEGVYSLTSDAKLIPCISLNDEYINTGYSLLSNKTEFEWEEISNDLLENNKELKLKGEICEDCQFCTSCTPCPASLKKDGINSSIFKKCEKAIIKVKEIIKRLVENDEIDKLVLNPGMYEYKNGYLEIIRVYSNGVIMQQSISIDEHEAKLILDRKWNNLALNYKTSENLETFIFDMVAKDLVCIVGENSYETNF